MPPKFPYNLTIEQFLKAQKDLKYPPHPKEISAVQKLLSTTDTPISEIAKEAISHLPKDKPNSNSLWILLSGAVERFPEFSDRYVDFIVELEKLPDDDSEYNRIFQFKMFWNGYCFTIADWPSTDTEREAKRQAQANQHAFLAKLTTREVPNLDFIGDAGRTLRWVCEIAPWENFSFPDIEWYYDPDDEDWPAKRDEMLEKEDVRCLNGILPLAAEWIKRLGDRMYVMKGEFHGEFEYQQQKWTGTQGWSKERFHFWIERLEWISQVTALEKGTQRLATELAEQMRKIEESH